MTDDEQIRKERNDQNRALVHKIMKEAQAKYDRYWNDYQTCGGASQLRTARKYEDLVICCELALRELDEGCENCLRRYRNGKAMADQLRQRRDVGGETTISIDEAIALVETASSIF